MPDTLTLLKTRRSIPAAFLSDPGPDGEALRDLLTIGTRVPDHGKLAPWRFVLVTGENRGAFADAIGALHLKKRPDDEAKREEIVTRYRTCPLSIAVISRTAAHPKIPEWEQFISAGAVAMNLVVAAHALGYAAQWLTGWVAEDADAARLLGARDGEKIVALIHVGTPRMPPSERARPDIDALTTNWSPENPG